MTEESIELKKDIKFFRVIASKLQTENTELIAEMKAYKLPFEKQIIKLESKLKKYIDYSEQVESVSIDKDNLIEELTYKI
jgi:hypothetical protein